MKSKTLIGQQMRLTAAHCLSDALDEWEETRGHTIPLALRSDFAAFMFARGFDGALAFREALAETHGIEVFPRHLRLVARDALAEAAELAGVPHS